MFSNLAYGAQGIQYFNYWTQSGQDTNPMTKFRNGPIDNITKKKTNVYYLAKEVNEEINNLMNVFYNSDVISVHHMGVEIPQGTNELKILPKIFKKLESNGANIIVSQLKKGNELYYVIVNKDFENEIEISIQLTSSSVKEILNTGSLTSVGKKSKVERILPGDVLIYTIKQ